MGQIQDKRIFTGGINSDDTNEIFPQGDFGEDTYNIVIVANDGKNVGKVKTRKGNELISFTLPIGTNKCISKAKDNTKNILYYFVYNSFFNHAIYEYTPSDNSIVEVIKDPVLAFSYNKKIRNPVISNGYLFWVDNNQPRQFNIEKMKRTTAGGTGDVYPTPILEQTIRLVKYPPTFYPTCKYQDDPSRRYNYLRGSLFQFAYKYIYEDNMESVYSTYSPVIYPTSENLLDGKWIDDFTHNNSINVVVPVESPLIKKVKVIARTSNIGLDIKTAPSRFFEVGTYDIVAPFQSVNINFFNDITGSILSDVELFNEDAVPLVAGDMEVIQGENLIMSDITEGFDNPEIDIELEVIQKEASVSANRDYGKYGIVATKTYSTDTHSVYSYEFFAKPQLSANTTYYLEIKSAIGNHFYSANYAIGATVNVSVFDVLTSLYNQIRTAITNSGYSYLLPSIYLGIFPSNLFDGNTVIADDPHIYLLLGYVDFLDADNPTIGVPVDLLNPASCRFYQRSDMAFISRTEKRGETKCYGLVYYDEAGRSGGACISDKSTIHIPETVPTAPSNLGIIGWKFNYVNRVKWKINHAPPQWAKSYQWVEVKDATIDKTVQFLVTSIENNTDGNVRVNVNESIRTYRDSLKKSTIPEWEWQKGDRIRFMGVYSNDVKQFIELYPQIDKEIIDIDYDTAFNILKKAGANAANLALENNNAINTAGGTAEQRAASVAKTLGVDKTMGSFVVEPFNIVTPMPNWPNIQLGEDALVIVEVYRPKKQLETKLYYEIGEIFPIINGQHYGQGGQQITDGVTYYYNDGSNYVSPGVTYYFNHQSGLTPASGIFQGDYWLKGRGLFYTTFPCEEKNFSDFYISEYGDYGRAFAVIPEMKRRRFKTKLRHGEKMIDETNINRINQFIPIAEKTKILPLKYGSISGIQEIGYTLKVFLSNKIDSIDIQRQQLMAGTGTGSLFIQKDLIGSERPTENEYGTIHPLSIAINHRYAYLWDNNNACVIRDSNNGDIPISGDSLAPQDHYKMITHFKNIQLELAKYDLSEVIGEYDKLLEEYILSFRGIYNMIAYNFHTIINTAINLTVGQKVTVQIFDGDRLIEETTGGVISEHVVEISDTIFTTTKYNYRIYIPIETIVFSEARNRWTTKLNQQPELFASIGQVMISFFDGNLWKHHSDNVPVNNFYGVQYKSRISTVFNSQSISDKAYLCISEVSEKEWGCPVIKTIPDGQMSRLISPRFEKIGSKYFAQFLCDVNTPGMVDPASLINGNELKGRTMEITFESDKIDNNGVQVENSLYEVTVESNEDAKT